jgi:hypothetical protein
MERSGDCVENLAGFCSIFVKICSVTVHKTIH